MKDKTLYDGIKRQELHLLFVIDNSGSMEGEKIGAVNNATIKNLNIEKAYVTGTTVVGGIAGYVRGDTTISNCSFSGKIKASSNFVGGIAGRYLGSDGKVFNINSCYTNGQFNSTGVIVGGFIGDFVSDSTNTITININNSYCAASVNGNDYRTAGFIGRASNEPTETKKCVIIRRSYFYGILSSNATGTLVGMDNSGITTVTDTYYNGDIIGDSIKDLTLGTSKSTTEFRTGVVTDLLNNSDKNDSTDLWEWEQGPKYPIKKGDATENYVLGDVNNDTLTDARDIVRLKKYVAEIEVSINISASDLNSDFSINAVDLSGLRNYLLCK